MLARIGKYIASLFNEKEEPKTDEINASISMLVDPETQAPVHQEIEHGE